MLASTCVAASIILGSFDVRAGAADVEAPATRTLTWNDVLLLARTRAPAVRVAAAKAHQAGAKTDLARAAFLPVVSASAGGRIFASNGSFVVNGVETAAQGQAFGWTEADVDLKWTAFDFGARSAARDAAAHATGAAELDREGEELSAMRLAASAFVTLIADDAIVATARETLATRRSQLETTRSLVSAGIRAPLDTIRVEVSLGAAELDIASAEAARANDRAALVTLLSLDDAHVEVADVGRARADADPTRAAADAIQRRPEVGAARRRIAEAEARRDAARAKRYPTLTFTGNGSLRYTQALSNDGAGPARVAAGNVTLDVPILDMTLAQQVAVEDSARAIAVAEADRRLREVRAEALQAAVLVQASERVVTQANALVSSARAALEQIEARYAAGVVGPLELQDATGADAIARLSLVRAQRDRDLAEVRLLAATGRFLR